MSTISPEPPENAQFLLRSRRLTPRDRRHGGGGIFQIGPCVYDWSATTGVARCLWCSWTALEFSRDAIARRATAHAAGHRLCSIDGCELTYDTGGYCDRHHRLALRDEAA